MPDTMRACHGWLSSEAFLHFVAQPTSPSAAFGKATLNNRLLHLNGASFARLVSRLTLAGCVPVARAVSSEHRLRVMPQ